jgi:hypothetical protein
MNLKNCKLIDLPKITDPEGNLTPIEVVAMCRSRSSGFSTFMMFREVLLELAMRSRVVSSLLSQCRGASMLSLMTVRILSDTTSIALTSAYMFRL